MEGKEWKTSERTSSFPLNTKKGGKRNKGMEIERNCSFAFYTKQIFLTLKKFASKTHHSSLPIIPSPSSPTFLKFHPNKLYMLLQVPLLREERNKLALCFRVHIPRFNNGVKHIISFLRNQQFNYHFNKTSQLSSPYLVGFYNLGHFFKNDFSSSNLGNLILHFDKVLKTS